MKKEKTKEIKISLVTAVLLVIMFIVIIFAMTSVGYYLGANNSKKIQQLNSQSSTVQLNEKCTCELQNTLNKFNEIKEKNSISK